MISPMLAIVLVLTALTLRSMISTRNRLVRLANSDPEHMCVGCVAHCRSVDQRVNDLEPLFGQLTETMVFFMEASEWWSRLIPAVLRRRLGSKLPWWCVGPPCSAYPPKVFRKRSDKSEVPRNQSH